MEGLSWRTDSYDTSDDAPGLAGGPTARVVLLRGDGTRALRHHGRVRSVGICHDRSDCHDDLRSCQASERSQPGGIRHRTRKSSSHEPAEVSFDADSEAEDEAARSEAAAIVIELVGCQSMSHSRSPGPADPDHWRKRGRFVTCAASMLASGAFGHLPCDAS